MGKPSKTTLHGRDARTGHFTKVSEARQKPSTHTVERVPKPGFGDTKPSPSAKTTLHGRDATSGEFTTVREARQKPSTHVVERVPKPGYGDTK